MADVYQHSENVLSCIQGNVHYYGFINGSEDRIKQEPITLYSNTINPGDKIIGFDSGKDRTSFELSYGFMIYAGKFGADILFEIIDPKKKPHQADLFNQRPKWFLSFAVIGPNSGLLMQSSACGFYDIHPHKIKRV
jgi:hypothetical protein